MNMLFCLSAIKVNELIGSEYKILIELISNFWISLTDFNRIVSIPSLPSLSKDA